MLRASRRLQSITIPSGPNAGLVIKQEFKNRNPRNLEMLNIAHRDCGWGVGPTFKVRSLYSHTDITILTGKTNVSR